MTQPRPQAASSAILRRGELFLLIRRRNPPSADMYAFPGGRAEPGESPAETALREFAEETGIAAGNPRLFATYDLRNEAEGGPHFFLSVFEVEADLDAVGEAADDAADLGWFSLDEIRRLSVPPSVLDCVERLMLRE